MAQTSKKFCSTCLKEVSTESFSCPGCNSPLTILHSRDLVGEILDGRFEVLELLGKGGMGIVYRARHRYLEQDCAIKVLRADSADDPLAVARFLREAKSASSLSSPHTVRVTDFGVSPDGLLYLVMELLEGESLGAMIQRKGSLPWRKSFVYAIHVCHSLQEAHSRHLWHRDIKPDNIFIVREDGEEVAKVLDFGIAKWGKQEATATEAGIICGTPEYLSPEQARGKDVDGRTDIYSLGAVLYEALAGRPPFEGDSAVKVLMCHIMDKPVPLNERDLPSPIPEEVANVVMWALKKKARRRPASVEDFAAAMQEVLDLYAGEPETPDAPIPARSSPTGLQFAARVADEDTEDEVVSAEQEETTGEFGVSEERLAAELAIAQQSTADSIYSRDSEMIDAPPLSPDPEKKSLRGGAALLGLLAFVAAAVLAGWYYQRTTEPKAGATYQDAAAPTELNSREGMTGKDLALSLGSEEEDARSDSSVRLADVRQTDARQLAAADTNLSEQLSEMPDISIQGNGRDFNGSVDSASMLADIVASDAIATDSLVTDATTADDAALTSPDVEESPSADEEAKERERQERRRKRLEAKKREEEQLRLAEEARKKLAEEQRLAEEARKKKEEEERKAKEQAKEKEEDEEDDYSRIPGGK